jgi:hypothetical protein
MLARCFVPGSLSHARYAARGIVVCERWFVFANFVRDLGLRPEGKTLDRIDNDKGYVPGNCRWATAREQARNTSRNKRVGAALQVDAAAAAGVHDSTILRRLRAGYSADQAVDSDAIRKVKLTAAEAREARAALHAGSTRADVALRFGISRQMVGLIARGQAWKHE